MSSPLNKFGHSSAQGTAGSTHRSHREAPGVCRPTQVACYLAFHVGRHMSRLSAPECFDSTVGLYPQLNARR